MLQSRLAWALGEDSKDSEEVAESPWREGARYEVMRRILLSRRHDEPEEVVGEISPGTFALVLAVSSFSDDDGQKATVAYLADTSRPRWLGGWALIARSEGFRPALRRVPGRGSWEVGGCYRVNGNPVVRSHVALESEPLCELKGAAEEVLLLELRLAISDDEPRLRGRVRTDSGAVGWLTLELPQEAPLLKPMNLLRKEAIVRSLWPFPVPAALDMAFAVGARREKRRPPVKSTTVAVYPWDVGGVYRTLAKLPITELPDEANPIGWLRAGKKVKVEAIEPGVQGQLKLRVQVESGTLAGCIGWMTTSIAPKDCCLDLRDQTEFEQVMDYWRKIAETGPAASSEAGACYTVRLQRQAGQALGLETIRLEQREGSFITLVENVLEGGPVSEWNQASPDCAVRRGDRILTVNGLDGEAMLNEMKRCEVMYMRLLRSTDGPGAAADVAEPESEAAVAMSLSAPVAPVAAVASESDSASHRRRRFPSAPERDSDEEVQWRLEKTALAQQMRVDEVPKRGGRLEMTENGSDWKPFYEGPVEETGGGGDCPCRSCRSRCQEEDGLLRALFSCGSQGPHPVTACAPAAPVS